MATLTKDLGQPARGRLSNAERETHLYWNLEERVWRAYSEVPKHQRRLAAMGWTRVGDEWEAPSHAVLIRKAVRVPRPVPTGGFFPKKGG